MATARGTPPPLTGASTVLFEKYSHSSGRSEPAVLLFRDAATGLFAEPGGGLDHAGEPPAVCAQRELREESLGLFRVDIPAMLPQPGQYAGQGFPHQARVVTTNGGRHVAYVMCVAGPRGTGIRRDDYAHNKRLLEAQAAAGARVPPHWRETDLMTRCFLRDLERAGLRRAPRGAGLHATDVYGRSCTLHPRTVSLLKKALDCRWHALHVVMLAGGACSHGLGDAGTALRARTRGGRARCYYA